MHKAVRGAPRLQHGIFMVAVCRVEVPNPCGCPAMNLPELISVAAFAAASALAVIGMWLVGVATVSVSPEFGASPMQNVMAVLHPGVWYVLAALMLREIGRRASE